MRSLRIVTLVLSLTASFSMFCSGKEQPPLARDNLEVILRAHRIGAWELDLSNLQKVPEDPDKFLRNMSRQLKVYEVTRPPAQDAYIYDILVDERRKQFWIQRKGGYAGVNEIYGVGILEPDGSIRYAEPTVGRKPQ